MGVHIFLSILLKTYQEIVRKRKRLRTTRWIRLLPADESTLQGAIITLRVVPATRKNIVIVVYSLEVCWIVSEP